MSIGTRNDNNIVPGLDVFVGQWYTMYASIYMYIGIPSYSKSVGGNRSYRNRRRVCFGFFFVTPIKCARVQSEYNIFLYYDIHISTYIGSTVGNHDVVHPH